MYQINRERDATWAFAQFELDVLKAFSEAERQDSR